MAKLVDSGIRETVRANRGDGRRDAEVRYRAAAEAAR